LIRRLALNNLVLFIQYGVGSLVPLLLVPYIVRQIGLSEFGTLAIAMSAAAFGTVVVQFAFQLTGPRQLMVLAGGDTPTDVVSRIGSAKIVLLVLVLVLVVSMIGLAALLGYRVSAPQAWLLAALPVAGALHTGWYLQTEGRFVIVSVLSIVGAALALAIGFCGVRGGMPVSAEAVAALALSAAPVWAGLATLWVSMRHLGRKSGSRMIGWRAPWRELRAGWPLFASQFAATLYGASGPIVIGALAGAEEAGAFGVIERISGAVVSACMLTHTAAYPSLVELYASDRQRYRRLLGAVIWVYLGVSAALVLGVLFGWNEVLQFLLGDKGANHGPLLAAAMVWIALGIFGPTLTGYFTASGQGHAALPLTLKILLVALGLGIPGVMIWGAWAWLAALCASQIVVIGVAARAWTTERTTKAAC
jgi:polysaccharide transporter, PST family